MARSPGLAHLVALVAAAASLPLGACRADPQDVSPAETGTAPATVGAAPSASAAERLKGSWTLHPGPDGMEALRDALAKGTGADPSKLDAMLEEFKAQLVHMRLVIDGSTMTTRDGEKVVATEEYEVRAEDGESVTLFIPKTGKEQKLVFLGPDEVSTSDEFMGRLTIRRAAN